MRIYNYSYLNKYGKNSIPIGAKFIFISGAVLNPLCCNLHGWILPDRDIYIKVAHNAGTISSCIWNTDFLTNANIGE